MKAMIIEQAGSATEFKMAQQPKPQVTAGQVLLEVKASSVNPWDYKVRSNQIPLGPDYPAILHGDVAGIVAEVGPGVNNFKVGDKVYGCAGGVKNLQGALAQYMLVDAQLIAKMPESLNFTQAAALPLVSQTAWQALIDKAQLQQNQTVLIHGGTGGVGHIAIQLAKYCGAKVYTTCSTPDKAALAKKLGADEVIFYKEQNVSDYVAKHTQGRGFDIVFDTIGGDNLAKSIEAVAPQGQVISILALGPYDLTNLFIKGASLHTVFQPGPLLSGQDRHHYHKILTRIADLITDKKLQPILHTQVFGFSEVAKAHELAESGGFIGKIVLQQDLV